MIKFFSLLLILLLVTLFLLSEIRDNTVLIRDNLILIRDASIVISNETSLRRANLIMVGELQVQIAEHAIEHYSVWLEEEEKYEETRKSEIFEDKKILQ